jgi:SWI/SNF-related matrix-associated actin-dependent regulator of chromatin subfamily A member 5
MRDYQMEALNWLIKIHDAGVNGILADEMVRPLTAFTVSMRIRSHIHHTLCVISDISSSGSR